MPTTKVLQGRQLYWKVQAAVHDRPQSELGDGHVIPGEPSLGGQVVVQQLEFCAQRLTQTRQLA